MRFVICLFLLAGMAKADELPAAPVARPTTVEEYRFRDLQNSIAFTAMAGARAFDAVQTCRRFAQNGHRADGGVWVERELPTQTCGGVVAFSAGYVLVGSGAAYLLHKTGHHKLERVPMWLSGVGAAQGIEYSFTKH